MTESDSRQQPFSEKMTDILNYGALNLAMGIGYQTRLFDVMDTLNDYSTASVIAEKAGLSTRYVTEWLAVMTCGGIIELSVGDDGTDSFHLPQSHADLLTRRSGNSNLGVYTQEIPLLTECAMKAVITGFLTGEGVGYDHYPDFQNFMTQLADAKHRRVLVNEFLPSVDNGRIIEKLASGIRVCDLGCAEGVVLMLMACAFPNSEFVGMDISSQAIGKAVDEARRQNMDNVIFIQTDVADIQYQSEYAQQFDYVMAFDAIHDQVRPMDALKSVYAMLKPGGLFSMVDIAAASQLTDNLCHPMGPFLYTVSLMHCMPVGLVDGGAGLGMMWGRQKAVAMLKSAGFHSVTVEKIPDDSFNLHFLCVK